ncbi:MAG TPA: T9SS type A sorting domain-containing protein [Candidatus Kapabacteria bacterium]|nr:T9SS type A sorting domain-containing protein [Candidatus Kapabacteria bacterium]HPO62588.1 T9SS type A sorting domain-containing protein [Candidatus Kapabacteria bacterium]
MKTKLLLLIATAMVFAMPLLATPPAEPDLAIEWQKYMYPTEISFAKFSADGNYIYCAVGNTIQKMDASNGEFVSTFENKDVSGIYEMQISKNGKTIVTRDGGGGLNLWDIETEKAIKYIPLYSEGALNGAFCVDITPDGNFLIIGYATFDEVSRKQYYNLFLYDIKKSEIIKSIPIDGRTNKIKISNEGSIFAFGTLTKDDDEDKWFQKLTLWDFASFQEIAVLENNELDSDWGYRHLKFSNDDNYLIAVRSNKIALSYNLVTNEIYKRSDLLRMCWNLEVLPDNNHYLIFYADWDGYYELELHNSTSKLNSYHYNDDIIETFGTNENWKVFYGGGRADFYLFKKTETGVSPNVINNENISITTNNNLISIDLIDINTEQLSIIISDLLGKTIYTENIQVSQSNSKIPINIYLNTGTYLCKVIAGNKEYTQKIEIVR